MLNRYRMAVSQAEVRLKFAVVVVREAAPLPEAELIAKSSAYVVRNYGGPILDVMSWGFPSVQGKATIDLVGNVLLPFWRDALDRPDQRCLVPATQFCEHGKVRGGADESSSHWFEIPAQPIFAFAGAWRDMLEGPVFAILTTSPNAMMDKIHAPLMPLILHEKHHELWLTGSGDEARALARPFPSSQMRTIS